MTNFMYHLKKKNDQTKLIISKRDHNTQAENLRLYFVIKLGFICIQNYHLWRVIFRYTVRNYLYGNVTLEP